MNSGIQDAGNLAWKLHQVLSLAAPESVLDSYEDERRPNAQKLIEFTHQIVTLATQTGHEERQMRDSILAALSGVPGVIDALARRFSQIAIGYGDSNEPFAPGTRVNPDTINADDLAWSLLTPDAAPPCLPDGFKVTLRMSHNPLRCDLTVLSRPKRWSTSCSVSIWWACDERPRTHCTHRTIPSRCIRSPPRSSRSGRRARSWRTWRWIATANHGWSQARSTRRYIASVPTAPRRSPQNSISG